MPVITSEALPGISPRAPTPYPPSPLTTALPTRGSQARLRSQPIVRGTPRPASRYWCGRWLPQPFACSCTPPREFVIGLDLDRSVHQCRSTKMCWWRLGWVRSGGVERGAAGPAVGAVAGRRVDPRDGAGAGCVDAADPAVPASVGWYSPGAPAASGRSSRCRGASGDLAWDRRGSVGSGDRRSSGPLVVDSTVAREIDRNGGRDAYRAVDADAAAYDRALRPKPSKLATDPVLREQVSAKKLGVPHGRHSTRPP